MLTFPTQQQLTTKILFGHVINPLKEQPAESQDYFCDQNWYGFNE